MDLISSLASTVGLEPKQAQALAGTVLGGVRSSLEDEEGSEQASRLDEAIPELSGWQAQAASLLGGGGGGGGLGAAFGGAGGLLGAAAGALGGQQAKDAAAVVALLGRFDVDPAKAALVAPMILSFLKDRLNPQLLSSVLAVAPMLSGAAPEGGEPSGGIGGLLGGLFG
ncbi:MAG: hypothetical protein H6741_35040 [Alphaproteobacteria bacterium]|nr:hypothetical protein [Alphaproteobacteria bacterium]MCB9797926.1 hypothetical protein [Alphaproteobacteria bacterium]